MDPHRIKTAAIRIDAGKLLEKCDFFAKGRIVEVHVGFAHGLRFGTRIDGADSFKIGLGGEK